MKSLIIGEAASAGDLRRIETAILGGAEVRRLIHMRTQHMGPDQLLIAAKLEFTPPLSLVELSRAIDVVEERIRATLPIAQLIYIEPAVYDPTEG